ncbi:MAG: hypothetical protein QXM16_06380 [Nitrososphaerota archaeon]
MIEEVIRSIGDSLRDDCYFAALIATLTILWIEQRRVSVRLLEKNIISEDFYILPGIVALIVIKYLLPWLVSLI